MLETATQEIFNKELHTKIQRGVERIYKVAKTTMGPNGRTVLLNDRGEFTTTKDGKDAVQPLWASDPVENAAIQLVKQAAKETLKVAGDGTTTSIVLTYNIYLAGLEAIQQGSNVSEVQRGMEAALQRVVERLEDNSIEIDLETAEGVAVLQNLITVSLNGDKVLGKSVTDAFRYAQRHGEVSISPAKQSETEVVSSGGMWLNAAMLDPAQRGTNKEWLQISKPRIILINAPLTGTDQFNHEDGSNWLEDNTGKQPIVIFCQDASKDFLQYYVDKRLSGKDQQVYLVSIPMTNGSHYETLLDIHHFTSATIYDSVSSLSQMTDKDVGRCLWTRLSEESIVLCGPNRSEGFEDHISELFERPEISAKRLSNLTASNVTIKVGASTDAEWLEKRARVDDAVRAGRIIQKDNPNVVMGGGLLLKNISELLFAEGPILSNDDQDLGYHAVINSLSAPFVTILKNAHKPVSEVSSRIAEEAFKDRFFGYNLKEDRYGNMVDMGIVEPLLVPVTALTNAVSVAGTLLGMGAAIFSE